MISGFQDLPPCGVVSPAGFLEFIHTPGGTKQGFDGDEFTATCTNCGAEIVQFWIDGEDDRYGRWSGWTFKRRSAML